MKLVTYERKIEEEMLGSLDDGRLATPFASRRLQLDSVDQLAAFVALVTTGVFVAAERTGPFHESISQEPTQKRRGVSIPGSVLK